MTDDVRSPVLVIADHFHNQRSAVERLVQRRIPDDNDERSVVAQLRSAQLSTQTPITNFPFTGKRQVATTVHPISCSLHGVLHDRHTPPQARARQVLACTAQQLAGLLARPTINFIIT